MRGIESELNELNELQKITKECRGLWNQDIPRKEFFRTITDLV